MERASGSPIPTALGPYFAKDLSRYNIVLYMKAIQITLDAALLARLDADEEVKRDGRSAVLRRAADLYLRQRTAREVAAAYRRAYADERSLGTEFGGWEREGAWPVE